jgi:8-oxo-dGTP diphosphatase
MSTSPIDWATWSPVTPATLMFIVRNGEILLIEKKRGHGAGKVNGPGGKIDPGETPRQAAIRETQEELGITPLDPVKVGELWFAMSDVPDILCHVYRAEDFEGSPVETDEAVPLWTPVEAVPYDRMWADDVAWLPLVIEGVTFRGRFVFDVETMLWSEVGTGLCWES